MFKTVIKRDDKNAEILDFSPSAIEHGVPDRAVPFVREQGVPTSTFIMNDLIATTTGVKQREKANYLKDLEKGVLEKLKEVQEPAYKEAYELGLKDGKEKAYADNNQTISEFLKQFSQVLQEMKQIKTRLQMDNEQHMLKLVRNIASTIAQKEITQSPDIIKSVLEKALTSAQAEEEIKIKMNAKDLEFINSLKGKHGDPLDKIPKVTLEASELISSGGCAIETNYGGIDATVETRVKEIWATIDGITPKPTEEKNG